MKNIHLFFLLISLGLLIVGCSSEENETTQQDTVKKNSSSDALKNYEEFDLRPYEINASLLLPKGETASVKHQLDSFSWQILLGKQVYVTIQDWGTENGMEHYLKKLKKQNSQIDFIEQEDDFVKYKSTVGTSKITYHTAAQHKIEGINYIFESNSKVGLSKEKIEQAVVSVKSVEQING